MTTLKDVKKTITSIFLVPSLHIPKEALKENNFLNGFIKDDMHDAQYENAIFLLFKPQELDRFREFLDSEYERTKLIIEDYNHGDFVIVVYQLNPEYLYDFSLIKQGKYSKTSLTFQKEFPKTVTIVKNGTTSEQISLQYRIFNKTEDLIKYWEEKFDVDLDETQELWNGFVEEDEILTEEILKEYE